MDYGEKANNDQQRKGRVREESDPLYEPEDAVLDGNMQRNILAMTCHLLAKTGFGEPVKQAVAQMDAAMAQPTPEGEQPVTPAEAVAHVLPSSKFLQNVGLEPAAQREALLLLHVYMRGCKENRP